MSMETGKRIAIFAEAMLRQMKQRHALRFIIQESEKQSAFYMYI